MSWTDLIKLRTACFYIPGKWRTRIIISLILNLKRHADTLHNIDFRVRNGNERTI